MTPALGTTEDTYNFTVVYSDEDGDPAVDVVLELGGSAYDLTEGKADAEGTTFYAELGSIGPGRYSFWIHASDGHSFVATQNITGPEVKGLAEPVLSGPSATPSWGFAGDRFTFSVIYSDPDDDAPEHVTLNIGDRTYGMTRTDFDRRYADGVTYSVEAWFEPGTYDYNFSASDGVTEVRLADGWSIDVVHAIRTYDNAGVHLEIAYTGTGDVGIALLAEGPDMPLNLIDIGIFVNLSAPASMGMVWANFSIPYNGSALPAGQNETNLTLYYFNGTHWVAPPSQGVLTAHDLIWANVTHFTVFAPVFPFENTAPTLSEPSVDPRSGSTSTEFTFRVKYRDIDGNDPLVVKAVVGDHEFEMTRASGEVLTWATYEVRTTLPAGEHAVAFLADDGYGGNASISGGRVTVGAGEEEEGAGSLLVLMAIIAVLVVVVLVVLFRKGILPPGAAARRKKAAPKKKGTEKPVAKVPKEKGEKGSGKSEGEKDGEKPVKEGEKEAKGEEREGEKSSGEGPGKDAPQEDRAAVEKPAEKSPGPPASPPEPSGSRGKASTEAPPAEPHAEGHPAGEPPAGKEDGGGAKDKSIDDLLSELGKYDR